MKLARIIVPHSKDCFMKGKAVPWSGLTDQAEPYYYGNHAANRNAKVGAYHVWYRCTCNDSKCPAIKAVHSSVLKLAK